MLFFGPGTRTQLVRTLALQEQGHPDEKLGATAYVCPLRAGEAEVEGLLGLSG